VQEQPQPVNDEAGRPIGYVRRVELGRSRRVFWEARALDGIDLGAHALRVEAEDAIWDDWTAGRPRSPRSVHERWRPLWDGPDPIYLGSHH